MQTQKVLYWSDENPVTREYVIEMTEKYGHLDGKALIETFVRDMPGKIALVSSFGTEAALLLQMAASVDTAIPVLFIDTLKLFPETLAYRDALVEKLGLTNVKTIKPDTTALTQEDPKETLWQFDPDSCCALRKVAPLDQALDPYWGWITGRKRAHGGARGNLPLIEISNGKLKLNPLASWTQEQVNTAFDKLGLPRHPLQIAGYQSVGCTTCTAKTQNGANSRSGRWAGLDKTECGIHLDNGKFRKTGTGN